MNYLELLNRFYNLLQCSQVSSNGQLLYHTLLMINNKSSWSDWFSRTNLSLCGLMGVSENTMKRSRAELKQLGLIDFKPSKRKGESTQYHICTKHFDTQADTKPDTQADTKPDTQADTKPDTQADTIDKLKQKTKTKKSIAKAIPEKCAQNLAQGIPQDTIDRYIASMEALGKPMTPSGLEMLFKRLEKLAPGDKETQTEIMEQTIRNSWKDVYPLKDNAKTVKTVKPKPNAFHNFEQRDTNYDAIVLERLKEKLDGAG